MKMKEGHEYESGAAESVAESRDFVGRMKKRELRNAIIIALIATFASLAIFILGVFLGEIELRTIRGALPYLLVVLFSVACWMIVVGMARGLYLGALKKFYETEGLYLNACQERESLRIKLDLMREEKVAIEGYWHTEKKRREDAEDRLARRIEAESA